MVKYFDGDSVSTEIEQSDEYKEEVYTIMVRIDSSAIAASRGGTTPPPSPGGGGSVVAGSVGVSRDASVRLPKLTI